MKERGGATVAVIDGGGRGSVLVDKYAQSPHVKRILAVPGNDLMEVNTDKEVVVFNKSNKSYNNPLKTTSVPEILEICEREGVDLVDVAQDNAVEVGLVNELEKKGIPTVGPTKEASQIEWDKAWAREFGDLHKFPQPSFKICLSKEEGIEFLKNQPEQDWFIKAAFLAEGKGALPAHSNQEAAEKIVELQRRFKDAARVFLIEKWLKSEDGTNGEEFSTFVVSDGEESQIAGNAQDHKRVNNFDEGENTGGMGCSSPPLVLSPDLLFKTENIFKKTIAGLRDQGKPYKGVLYLGGMIVREQGLLVPKIVEFNARWGDPEAQVVLPGIVNDLFEVSMAIANGDIRSIKLKNDGKARVAVTGASKGYPGNYDAVKNKQIFGLDEVRKLQGVKLYSAAISSDNGTYRANGGRLFYIVGEGTTVIEARERAYGAMSLVHIEGNNLHFRTDIGWRDVQRLRK